nr:hypothetical protein [Pseudonocardia sp. HH130630-07]
MQCRPLGQRGRVRRGTGPEQAEPLGHAVGGEVRGEVEPGTERERGVGAVHRDLVQTPPHPPGRRLRPGEGPHRSRGIGTDGGEEVGRGVPQPLRGDVRAALRGLPALDRTRVQRLGGPRGDHLRGPAVTPPDVPEQLQQAPAGAGRHLGREVGARQQRRQPVVLRDECRRVRDPWVGGAAIR